MRWLSFRQPILIIPQEAKRYFDTLPDYAREQIQTRSGSVNSFASLRDYAENILRGDD